ncbi:sugar porter family MFS transporter [Actinoallomurus bryophytorum]|uniref:Sugar porter (SP) family MFS transporter n=1 Tax=Actinoallomurus bryophytorum TaxID=1490222 RepID=A0A543CU15_9ACTN|nr:sugar porter family MFS transporter [Actinoallomurus bryophytorum]TQM00398.1 sugar porter (SP) family MFS transporter [Actinoallomurus bryophytorum]
MPSYLREASRNPFVLKISLLAALGGLLFGYDTGVISGALLYIKKDLHAGDLAQSWIVAGLLVGAVVGALAGGRLADLISRRWTLLISGIVYVAAALAAAFAQSSGQLVAARMVLGLAVGAASAVVPLYIAEHTPPKIRGGTVSYNQLMVTVGILVAYLIDFALRNVGSNWRWMLGIGALPGVFLVIGMLFVPYSPRWLMQKGRRDEAREVLRRTRRGEDVEEELSEIESVLAEERSSGLRALLRPSLRPMLVIGIGLAVIQQVVGVNTVVYFSPTILTYTGLHANDAIAQALSVGITNVVFTIIAVLLLDLVGRRALLIAGTIGLTVALLTLAAFFAFDWKDSAPWVALVALVLFIASFAIGLGPGFWLMISEIFPLGVRGSAMAVCSVFNWGANFFVSYYFLQLVDGIGKAWTFSLYAVMGVVGIVFFLTKVPETKNRTLEEIERDLGAPASGTNTREQTA